MHKDTLIKRCDQWSIRYPLLCQLSFLLRQSDERILKILWVFMCPYRQMLIYTSQNSQFSYLRGSLRMKFHLILINGIYLVYKSIIGFSTWNAPKGIFMHICSFNIPSLFQQIFIKYIICFSNSAKVLQIEQWIKKKRKVKTQKSLPEAYIPLTGDRFWVAQTQ